MWIYILPFALQGTAMFFDEFYFHRRRQLPLWEKIGHPLDTLSVLICYLYILIREPSQNHLLIYIGLCFFSCLLITKDEFVHTQLCEAKENWVHSLLFVLHPITFVSAGFVWWYDLNPELIALQVTVIIIFLFYQIIYWSSWGEWLWRK